MVLQGHEESNKEYDLNSTLKTSITVETQAGLWTPFNSQYCPEGVTIIFHIQYW